MIGCCVLAGPMPTPLHAQVPRVLNAITNEDLTIAGTSVGLLTATITPDTRGSVTECRGVVETAQIRMRWTGTAPTAANGELVEIGSTVIIRGTANISRWRAIRTGAVSARIYFTCSR